MMKKILLSCFIFICCWTFGESLEEWSSCINFDGSTGICVVDRNCKWALEKLKSKEIKVSQLVRCGLKGTTSIICCKDDTIMASTVKSPTKSTVNDFYFGNDNEEVPRTLRKCEQACELYKTIKPKEIEFHIINGEGADLGEFPHMTAIGFADDVDVTKFTYDCGGSLISKNFVLTAGHCVNSRVRQPRSVKLGKNSLNPLDDEDTNVPQDIPIKKVYLYPTYSARKKYNDIALLELEHAVEYMKAVKPACLSTMKGSFDKSQSLFITGWGLTNTTTREKATWLQKAEIFEVPLTECNEIYAGINLQQLPENLLPSQLCATSTTKEGKILDGCQGDSGGEKNSVYLGIFCYFMIYLGPLKHRIGPLRNQEYVFYIVGVTSFGASCGSDIPGVYTRVSEYLDWIEGIVWPNKVEL